jgi:hypothetical protein
LLAANVRAARPSIGEISEISGLPFSSTAKKERTTAASGNGGGMLKVSEEIDQ